MTAETKTVLIERDGDVLVVTINRPKVRNAVDNATAHALAAAFQDFENDAGLNVAVLTGTQGTFCAGADLREIAEGRRPPIAEDGQGPMGPTWMLLSKPVIAAVEGHAVAGGLELALWCDLRVAARDAVFGIFNRRFGVPLIDLGTVRLPRLIGQSHALDLILTGRGVSGEEALEMGLVNRLVEPGRALEHALLLAHAISEFPQRCLRADRLSAYEQWSLPWDEARRNELRHGLEVLASGEAATGATRFAKGAGRHGARTENE
jgi:enoyl-CoA hydratase